MLRRLGIHKIDLYGDSYGTFFSQTFALRHPGRLRSLVLDAAYFVDARDPYYIDTNRALRDAFRFSCRRSPPCARRAGDSMRRMARLAERLRERPITGRAPNADGVVRRVEVDVGGLIYLATSAATTPSIYRELDAAMRAALRPRPYERPLLRLARETYYVGGAGPARQYSKGLYVAVACNDYPQPYDMRDPVAQRRGQYRRSVRHLREAEPDAFAPFTVREWVTSPVEYYDSCLEWPISSRVDRAVPSVATFPDVPTLVLAGDLDSLTSPEGARRTAAAFPNSTYVEVANMTHVAALADYDRCASVITRRFVRSLEAGDTSCAAHYNEIRLVDRFARRASAFDRAGSRRTTARLATATVGDVMARWLGMYGYSGVGLRGGTFRTRGSTRVRWWLDRVRWVAGVGVSGKITWARATGRVRANVSIRGPDAQHGRLRIRWNDWRRRAQAVVSGRLGGRHVRFRFYAP